MCRLGEGLSARIGLGRPHTPPRALELVLSSHILTSTRLLSTTTHRHRNPSSTPLAAPASHVLPRSSRTRMSLLHALIAHEQSILAEHDNSGNNKYSQGEHPIAAVSPCQAPTHSRSSHPTPLATPSSQPSKRSSQSYPQARPSSPTLQKTSSSTTSSQPPDWSSWSWQRTSRAGACRSGS